MPLSITGNDSVPMLPSMRRTWLMKPRPTSNVIARVPNTGPPSPYAAGRLADSLLEEEVRGTLHYVFPPQRTVVLGERLALTWRRCRRVCDYDVAATHARAVAGCTDELRPVTEIVFRPLLHG